MEVHKFSSRNIGGIVLIVAIVIIGLVVFPSSCTVVNPNERGVEVKLGQVQGDVIQPGLVWHVPFITKIRKFRLEPKTYEVSFSCGSDFLKLPVGVFTPVLFFGVVPVQPVPTLI